jgi:ankyrin
VFAVVQVLLKHGSDVNAVTRNGWSPLHSSSQYGHLEAAQLLLDHGAELGFKTTGGETALHMVSGEGNLELA